MTEEEKLKRLHEQVFKKKPAPAQPVEQGVAPKAALRFEDLDDAAKQKIVSMSGPDNSINKIAKATGYHKLVVSKVLKEHRKKHPAPTTQDLSDKIDRSFRGYWPGKPSRGGGD